MEENKKYADCLEAAMLINPKYTTTCVLSSMNYNVRAGHIEEFFPQLAIVEDGQIVQLLGESKKAFFLIKEIEDFVKLKSKRKGFNVREVEAILENGKILTFGSCSEAAIFFNIHYSTFVKAARTGKKIKGTRFSHKD